jgi:predicted transcriptional regulator
VLKVAIRLMEVNMQGLKENVISMIKSMSKDVSIEDIMAELYFRYEVDQGIKQLDEGKGIPHEEIERRMKKWLKK